jgi:hypothetical protein
MLIYVCNSGHGFGHGSRTAAVMEELATLRPEWRLVISTSLPRGFLDLAYGRMRVEHRACRWDVGVVQANALQTDPKGTLHALTQLELELPAQLEREAIWLLSQNEPVVIVADVPPAAALLAERVGAPLIWLASFGWDAIYGAMEGAFQDWASRCRDLYQRGDLLIQCPMAMPMEWGIPRVAVGVTSSRPRLDVGSLRQQLSLPEERERVVLISFGGLGLAVDPALLAHWPDHVFVGLEPAFASIPNGRMLPCGARPLDLMPLTGRLITKPGYSSFCEAFSQGVGIHLVERHGFAEAAVLREALVQHGLHRILSQSELLSGAWKLNQPLCEPRLRPLPLDGARTAAEVIAHRTEV